VADRASRAWWVGGLACIVLVYLHNTLPYLTTMPRVNVDEPWLIERAYQVLRTGVPSQPMLGLRQAYLLQVGYGYLVAPWLAVFGVGIFQARLLGVVLGLGIVLMVAAIGRRTIDATTGLAAALFLAADSNFLGGVRNARTDIPSVFFVTAALAAYVVGRQRAHAGWFALSGASLGLAMLCHGNAFWAGAILLGWYCLDYGRRALQVRFGYWFAAGLFATFGPYLIVVASRWRDVQLQIGNFAGDRVPGWRPWFVWQQMTHEADRYRNWYFGLVTNAVPNPLLWAFQALIVVGVVALAASAWSSRRWSQGPQRGSGVGVERRADPEGAARLLILAVGAALIFAGFINNKVAVYIPHLLIGFSLAAGFAVSEGARALSALHAGPVRLRATTVAAGFLVAYGAASVAYYEKWYSSARKSELVSYEETAATLHALVSTGPKYLYASPQFWTPFHAEPGTTFFSYAAAQPVEAGGGFALAGADADRPIFLVVDELQWLPELTTAASSSSQTWQQAWVAFIERGCALEGAALGTAHGTLALYRCSLAQRPPATRVRLIGGANDLVIGERIMHQTAADLMQWERYQDGRRTAAGQPRVELDAGRVHIHGTGWPGIFKMLPLTPGERYLVRTDTSDTRSGDLLYLGTWQQPQVRSLSGASSAGIVTTLLPYPWFPSDRAFVTTASPVRILIYSEAAETDFLISSLEIYRLTPVPAHGAGS
jgi:4-amino-4-deoxy-L-arabinose transferase-like glycosyltransferase